MSRTPTFPTSAESLPSGLSTSLASPAGERPELCTASDHEAPSNISQLHFFSFFMAFSPSVLHKAHSSGCSPLQRAEFWSYLSGSLGFVFTMRTPRHTEHFRSYVSSLTHLL